MGAIPAARLYHTRYRETPPTSGPILNEIVSISDSRNVLAKVFDSFSSSYQSFYQCKSTLEKKKFIMFKYAVMV